MVFKIMSKIVNVVSGQRKRSGDGESYSKMEERSRIEKVSKA